MKLTTGNNATYYDFQRLVGGTLLVWGGLNVVAGAAAQASANPVVKHFGLQALAWGAIDAVIALFGLRDAKKKQHANSQTQARRFRLIVAANALLDVGYVAGGAAALRSAQGRAERVGLGVGIIVQGLFLLLFDLALTALSGMWSGESGER